MSQQHEFYLNLGSNIEPETNLARAMELLEKYGKIGATSNVWESRSIGAPGPNFLNVCVRFFSARPEGELKRSVLRPIERALGRVRRGDKNAARTIDIDVLLSDGKPVNSKRWGYAFVVVPLSELLPHASHPLSRESLSEAAKTLLATTWMMRRPELRGSVREGAKD